MPIITPCFPAFNTTHNVNLLHVQIITQELNRGLEIVKKVQEEIEKDNKIPKDNNDRNGNGIGIEGEENKNMNKFDLDTQFLKKC